jgi:hypothetical protein
VSYILPPYKVISHFFCITRSTIFLDIDRPLKNARTDYAGQGFDPVALKAVDPENWTGGMINLTRKTIGLSKTQAPDCPDALR